MRTWSISYAASVLHAIAPVVGSGHPSSTCISRSVCAAQVVRSDVSAARNPSPFETTHLNAPSKAVVVTVDVGVELADDVGVEVNVVAIVLVADVVLVGVVVGDDVPVEDVVGVVEGVDVSVLVRVVDGEVVSLLVGDVVAVVVALLVAVVDGVRQI